MAMWFVDCKLTCLERWTLNHASSLFADVEADLLHVQFLASWHHGIIGILLCSLATYILVLALAKQQRSELNANYLSRTC